MRLTHRSILLAVATIATIAFTTGSASAAPIAIVDESAGDPCNPCDIHAAGTSILFAHVPLFGEVAVSACQEEFEGELNQLPNGAGVIGHVTYSNNHEINDDCTRINCAEAQEREWPLTNPEEVGANEATVDLEFCLAREGGEDTHCNLTIELTEATTHDYFFSSSQDHECVSSPTASHIEVVGTWPLETDEHDAIEIVHL